MRKKELLTAILCIVVTIGIIFVVMQGGNKQHPDITHEAEAKTSEIDVATEFVHVHPLRSTSERNKQLYDLTTEELAETLELDDLEDELEPEEEEDELIEENVEVVDNDETPVWQPE